MSYKILHMITTLATGGAESMLYKLLIHSSNKSVFKHRVVSLSGPGYYGSLLSKKGIPVYCLDLDVGTPRPIDLFRTNAAIKKWNPHIVQTWLYHADLLGLIIGWLNKVPKILWNIRCSNMDLKQYAPTTRRIFSLLAMLSYAPDAVISNSETGRRYHTQAGYTPKRWEVIPNGFDTKLFKPDVYARKKLKKFLGIDKSSLIVGMVARYDPMKDHNSFFNAAKIVNIALPGIHFVLIGKGVDGSNFDLKKMIRQNDLEGKMHLLGQRTDIQDLYPAFDVFVLTSSFGEGFPNVLGEAMACCVPCVATNIGESATLIGNTGKIVPPRNHEAMANAWMEMLLLSPEQRVELGLMARKRVDDRYSIVNVVQRYEKLYSELLH